MKSNEGTTQSDPVSIAIYGIRVTPLINILINIVITSPESQDGVLAGADNFSAARKLYDLRKWWDTLIIICPKFRYYPEPTKAWLVVKQYASQQTKRLRSPRLTKLRSPIKGTGTLEGHLAQRNLKVPVWKKMLWNGLISLKF